MKLTEISYVPIKERIIINMSTDMHKEISRSILHKDLAPSTESRIAWYHQMQENQPIRYRPEYNLWEVFRYKDVQEVLSDYANFSVEKRYPESFPSVLGKCDPPRHRQVRGLVSKVFSPHRLQELTPHLI